MEVYRNGAHTVYNIEYHFVWVTKYHYHILKGEIGHRVRELIRQSCEARELKILKGHVSKDHIHILVSCPPHLSPAKIMQYLKGKSSRRLQDELPALKKRYWGNHLWARGYFCATVGIVTEEQIRIYNPSAKAESFSAERPFREDRLWNWIKRFLTEPHLTVRCSKLLLLRSV